MFRKECKKIVFSLAFLIFVVVMIVDFYTQYGSGLTEKIAEPQPGQEEYSDYGYTVETDPDIMMQSALSGLIQEYKENSYTSYPLGFYKEVRLSPEKITAMGNVLQQLTGLTSEEIIGNDFIYREYIYDEAGQRVENTEGIEMPIVSEQVDYEAFFSLMQEADDLIGGGSSYDPGSLESSIVRGKTYEEALATYEEFKSGGYSTGYAWLLCDYLCIFATLFPAFIAVAEGLRDKNARMRDILYTRRVSSLRMVFTRYFAIVGLCSLVVLLIAGVSTIACWINYQSIAPLAFFQYTIIWVIPSIMISTAIGAFFTELTDTPIGLLIMLAYWFVSVNSSSTLRISEVSLLQLIPRHNDTYGANQFAAVWEVFLWNRVLFVVVSLGLMLITALILEQKRRGRWFCVGKIRPNSKNQSAA